jgi:hypothetical protein
LLLETQIEYAEFFFHSSLVQARLIDKECLLLGVVARVRVVSCR